MEALPQDVAEQPLDSGRVGFPGCEVVRVVAGADRDHEAFLRASVRVSVSVRLALAAHTFIRLRQIVILV
ncbi:MAG TPA: hypothetical protein DEP84_16705 [Chloroflexi bacterium]|nr:hypothetical protein [Chloroflexota bacterium]